MATRITNQATLTYQYGNMTGVASSNIATATLQEALTTVKTALDTAYRADQAITYILTMANSGSNALTNVTITDDLGTYTPAGGTTPVTPLTYAGPAQLYINGVLSGAITPAVNDRSIVFTIPSLAAGANAMILYKANVNGFAPLSTDTSITNTVSITADELTDALQDSHTLAAEAYANVSILKDMSPDPVTDGGVLTYSFTLYNYGNTEATNVVLRDAFSPAPAGLTVSINGTAVPSSGYTYIDGVLTLPSTATAITLTVPAATFTQDATTGAVTINPGMTTVTVSGTI